MCEKHSGATWHFTNSSSAVQLLRSQRETPFCMHKEPPTPDPAHPIPTATEKVPGPQSGQELGVNSQAARYHVAQSATHPGLLPERLCPGP